MEEFKLMKGNEALAEAMIRSGADAYFGYPITPQSEVMEYLMIQQPEERTGMVILQAESEIAAINMVYGAAAAGKRVVTSSSSPGISLMQESISYMAAAELPCVIVNVSRGGPGLGSLNPSQADYFQSTRGGGHGDYRTMVLAPCSVQEMSDHVKIAFEMAFKYRNPVIILSDGIIGQMMEKVKFFQQVPRWLDEDITKILPWASIGKPASRKQNLIDTVNLEADKLSIFIQKLLDKYKKMEDDVLYEKYKCDDADNILVSFGSAARVCMKAVDIARSKGIKLGLIRPITLYPFPEKVIKDMSAQCKLVMAVELSAGQMFEDVKMAINGATKVVSFTRLGGVVPSPYEIIQAINDNQ